MAIRKAIFSVLTLCIWFNSFFVCGLCLVSNASAEVEKHSCCDQHGKADYDQCKDCPECISSWPYDLNTNLNYSHKSSIEIFVVNTFFNLIPQETKAISNILDFEPSFFYSSNLVLSLTLSPNAPPSLA